jgi:hypothetical protein
LLSHSIATVDMIMMNDCKNKRLKLKKIYVQKIFTKDTEGERKISILFFASLECDGRYLNINYFPFFAQPKMLNNRKHSDKK